MLVVSCEPLEEFCSAACVAILLVESVEDIDSKLGRVVALLKTLVEVPAVPPAALMEIRVLVCVPGFISEVASCCTKLSGMLDT